jgi:DNA polymerase I-like protein with 3'-5' exonuclease and polymerase domains
MFTFDFETAAIAPRPDYPPAPVGIAYNSGGRTAHYYAFGHPEKNNAESVDCIDILESHWHEPLLCHNAAFDIAVACEKLGLPLPDGSQINDTMFLAFLVDPYGELSLKPLAEQYLGIPPSERDAVRDWLKANVKMPTGRPPTDKQCGALICKAPGDIVGKYAIGDVSRTKSLYTNLFPRVKNAGMEEAYRRECAIMPMLLDNSEQGIPLDWLKLERDIEKYEEVLLLTEQHLRMLWPKEIMGGYAPGNFDSGDELAECLERDKRIVLPKTPTGKTSTAKESLLACIPDCRVKGLLLYRSAIEKCLSTYMRPWAVQGKALHANWNQVRDYSDRGAVTGRLSSSPNLQNMTNPEKYEELHALMVKCRCDFDWATFPNLRSYIVAPKGMVLFSRDYSQQEFRFLAHFEDGLIADAYRADPGTDMHKFAMNIINETTRIGIERKPTKTINFGKVYGMGIPKLARSLKLEVEKARELMNAYDTALPSVKALMREVSDIGKRGEYITTIGGRRYYSQPASIDEDTGKVSTWEYKLLNSLIQGSAADQTKEAMRLWWQQRLQHSTNGTRFLMTIHDQLVGCAPKKLVKRESELLDYYMREAFTLDVPTKTDPTYGTNFGEMK